MPNEDFIPIVVLKKVVLVILKSPDVTNPCQDMVDLSFSLSLSPTQWPAHPCPKIYFLICCGESHLENNSSEMLTFKTIPVYITVLSKSIML